MGGKLVAMTLIRTRIEIARDPRDVYDYVTTPARWIEWHPSTRKVTGSADHSLAVGEECIEDAVVAGRALQVTWRVDERDEPRRWVISTRGGAVQGTITYTITPSASGGTEFQREFVYPTNSLRFVVANLLVIRRTVQAESAEAMRRLKQRLESPV
jgi:uncharacterized protein YndB with AHSA1/START domain